MAYPLPPSAGPGYLPTPAPRAPSPPRLSAEVVLHRRTPHPARSVALLLPTLAVLALPACSRRDRPEAGKAPPTAPAVVPASRPEEVPAAALPSGGRYQAVAVGAAGRIHGTVQLDGDAPADSAVVPTVDADVCGKRLTLPVVEHDGRQLGGAVVFLADIHAGRRASLERRFRLDNDGCVFRPAVQVAATGGTLNFWNADDAVIATRFTRWAPAAESLAVVGFTDAGEVIPLDRVLKRPGLVEARSITHPWARAWVAVFDHPYAVVTGRDGSFVLDSVPPGTYTLEVWHPRLGLTRQKVTVVAGQDATVDLTLKAR